MLPFIFLYHDEESEHLGSINVSLQNLLIEDNMKTKNH